MLVYFDITLSLKMIRKIIVNRKTNFEKDRNFHGHFSVFLTLLHQFLEKKIKTITCNGTLKKF